MDSIYLKIIRYNTTPAGHAGSRTVRPHHQASQSSARKWIVNEMEPGSPVALEDLFYETTHFHPQNSLVLQKNNSSFGLTQVPATNWTWTHHSLWGKCLIILHLVFNKYLLVSLYPKRNFQMVCLELPGSRVYYSWKLNMSCLSPSWKGIPCFPWCLDWTL